MQEWPSRVRAAGLVPYRGVPSDDATTADVSQEQVSSDQDNYADYNREKVRLAVGIQLARCILPILKDLAKHGISGVWLQALQLRAVFERAAWPHEDALGAHIEPFTEALESALKGRLLPVVECAVRTMGTIGMGSVAKALSPAVFLGSAALASAIASASFAAEAATMTNLLGDAFRMLAAALAHAPVLRKYVLRSLNGYAELVAGLREAAASAAVEEVFWRAQAVNVQLLLGQLRACIGSFPIGPRTAELKRAMQHTIALSGERERPAPAARPLELDERQRVALAHVLRRTASHVRAGRVWDMVRFLGDPDAAEFRAQLVESSVVSYVVRLRRLEPADPDEIAFDVLRAGEPIAEAVYMSTSVAGELRTAADVWDNIIRSCCTVWHFSTFDKYLPSAKGVVDDRPRSKPPAGDRTPPRARTYS